MQMTIWRMVRVETGEQYLVTDVAIGLSANDLDTEELTQRIKMAAALVHARR